MVMSFNTFEKRDEVFRLRAKLELAEQSRLAGEPSFTLTESRKRLDTKLTENGYTEDFEAEILAASREADAAVANGTAKLYKNTAEMFVEWEKEDAEDDD